MKVSALLDRKRECQIRRHAEAEDALTNGRGADLLSRDEIIFMPRAEAPTTNLFVEHDVLAARGDWIVPVLTYGRCASTSVYWALYGLSTSQLPGAAYHVHAMPTSPTDAPQVYHEALGHALGVLFEKRRHWLEWKFVSGVREPLAVALSGMFLNSLQGEDVTETKNVLTECVPGPLQFFDEILAEQVGVDVYTLPFDKQKGYSIYQVNGVELLIYRFESLSTLYSHAMKEYLGLDGLELPVLNTASERPYDVAYQAARDQIRFDRSFLDEIYSSRFVRHFYTSEEIEEFYATWAS